MNSLYYYGNDGLLIRCCGGKRRDKGKAAHKHFKPIQGFFPLSHLIIKKCLISGVWLLGQERGSCVPPCLNGQVCVLLLHSNSMGDNCTWLSSVVHMSDLRSIETGDMEPSFLWLIRALIDRSSLIRHILMSCDYGKTPLRCGLLDGQSPWHLGTACARLQYHLY